VRGAESRQQAPPGGYAKPRCPRQGKAGDDRVQGDDTSSSTCIGRVAVMTSA
jgi:hypothetical protein